MRQDWEHGHRFRGGRDRRAGRRPQIGGSDAGGSLAFASSTPGTLLLSPARKSGCRATAKAHAQSVFLRQRRDTAPEHLGSTTFARVASRRVPGFKSRTHRPPSLARLRRRDRGCLGSKERTVPGLRAQAAMRHRSTVSRAGDSAFVDPKSWQKMAVYDSESARPRIISVGATLSEIRVSVGRTLALR
jgi:hypothetical protein